ncbi:SDR family NAD(P)-dependent oxidoreductase [Acanthopleuribacter pedis]|uniref:SDR family NAD(P)-dependent oxidoreductase n=1 Tax=Acanthopleuribacter pedis TaxID=442870 RepID=A0A8J7QAS0_9BACT|nr:SDR family NAD(P)-dependent oxidoreductase [Acanthopleuribacter pedis]MBO1320209.1 SDR family NAD(P)-dependent oxidoreductase [Acanthopleuribacter pedis]
MTDSKREDIIRNILSLAKAAGNDPIPGDKESHIISHNESGPAKFSPLWKVDATYYFSKNDEPHPSYGEIQIAFGDLTRLENALNKLLEQRPVLMIRLNQSQADSPTPSSIILTLHDFRHRRNPEEALLTLRRKMETMEMKDHKWPHFEVCCSRLSGDLLRFHCVIDRRLATQQACEELIRELFLLYCDPSLALPNRVVPNLETGAASRVSASSVSASGSPTPAHPPEPNLVSGTHVPTESASERRPTTGRAPTNQPFHRRAADEVVDDDDSWADAISKTDWSFEADIARNTGQYSDLERLLRRAGFTKGVRDSITAAFSNNEGSAPESDSSEPVAEKSEPRAQKEADDTTGLSDPATSDPATSDPATSDPATSDPATSASSINTPPPPTPAPKVPAAPASAAMRSPKNVSEPPSQGVLPDEPPPFEEGVVALPEDIIDVVPPTEEEDPFDKTQKLPLWILDDQTASDLRDSFPPAHETVVQKTPKLPHHFSPSGLPFNEPPVFLDGDAEEESTAENPATASRRAFDHTKEPPVFSDSEPESDPKEFPVVRDTDTVPKTTPVNPAEPPRAAAPSEDGTTAQDDPEGFEPQANPKIPAGANPKNASLNTQLMNLADKAPEESWDDTMIIPKWPDMDDKRPAAEMLREAVEKVEARRKAQQSGDPANPAPPKPPALGKDSETKSTPAPPPVLGNDSVTKSTSAPPPVLGNDSETKSTPTPPPASSKGTEPKPAPVPPPPSPPASEDAEAEDPSWHDTMEIPIWVMNGQAGPQSPATTVPASAEPATASLAETRKIETVETEPAEAGPAIETIPVTPVTPAQTPPSKETAPAQTLPVETVPIPPNTGTTDPVAGPEAAALETRRLEPDTLDAEAAALYAKKDAPDQKDSDHNTLPVEEEALQAAVPEPEQSVPEPEPRREPTPPPSRAGDEPIAVIGMAGRFPRSPDMEMFWENLKAGRDCLSPLPRDRMEGEPPETPGERPIFGGFLEFIDHFDADLFEIDDTQASLMDPQTRLFMESVWAAVEDAGYTPTLLKEHCAESGSGDVGVFAGAMYSDYHLLYHNDDDHHLSIDPWSLANQISQTFDFTGPSHVVNTAGSSSLYAVHQACESLLRGHCEVAVAGGVNLYINADAFLKDRTTTNNAVGPRSGTADGGDGFAPGEGVAAVLLKPLSRAVADNDHIYGTILASTINHDGRALGFGLPNADSQVTLVRGALRRCDVSPRTISYVEAHGAGTVVGDPIEIHALSQAFDTGDRQFCALGSVKSNIGHGESASGIAGLVKVLLQMTNRTLVPSLHANYLNPNIQFKSGPFYVQRDRQTWEQPQIDGIPVPRRACLSSLGEGGTNVHLVLEESHIEKKADAGNGPYLIPLSAATPRALREGLENLRRYVLRRMVSSWDGAPLDLNALAYTLQVGRVAMAERFAAVVEDAEGLERALRRRLEEPESPPAEPGSGHEGDIDLMSRFTTDETPDQLFHDKNFTRLAQLWTEGWDIDWQAFYPRGAVPRIQVPTYPFQRRRYWVQPPPAPETTATSPERPSGGDPHPVHNRLSYFTQTLVPIPTSKEFSGYALRGRFILITAASVPENLLAQLLALPNVTWTTICKKTKDGEPDSRQLDFFEEDPAQMELPALTEIQGLVDISDLAQKQEDSIPWGKLNFIRDLVRGVGPRDFSLIHFSRNRYQRIFAPTTSEKTTVSASIGAGLIGVLGWEERHLKAVTIDWDGSEPIAQVIRRELGTAGRNSEICYRGNLRFQPVFLPRQKPTAEAVRYNGDKTYVIAGGTGNLGFAMADHLVTKGVRKLVLMGLRPLPPRDFWQNLAERGEEPTRGKIIKLMAFEKQGVQIKLYHGPLHERDRLALFFDQVEAEMGAVDGFFFNTGPMEHPDQLRQKPLSLLQAVLNPRIKGLQGMVDLIDSRPSLQPRFFICFGNSLSVHPALGVQMAALYAANQYFVDFCAAQRRLWLQREVPIELSLVRWGCWDVAAPSGATEHAGKTGLGPLALKEGMRALDHLLAEPHLVDIAATPATRAFTETIDARKEKSVSFQDRALTIAPRILLAHLPAHKDEAFPESARQLERFTTRLIFEALLAMGLPGSPKQPFTTEELAEKINLAQARLGLLGLMCENLCNAGLLVRHGKKYAVRDQAETMLLLLPDAKSIIASFPNEQEHVDLFESAAAALPKYLKTDPIHTTYTLSWLVHGRGSESFAHASRAPLVTLIHQQLGQTLASLITHLPLNHKRLRILQIGTNEHHFATYLLDLIRETGREATVHWTSASSREVRQAADLLADEYPFVRFAVLDLAVDPIKQGLELGSFDIVLACQELHGYRDLPNVLLRIKQLLKKDGMLLFAEETAVRTSHLLLQAKHPPTSQPYQDQLRLDQMTLLDEQRWGALLAACGYRDTRAAALPVTGNERAQYHMMLGFSDGAYWSPLGNEQEAKPTVRLTQEEIKSMDEAVAAEFAQPKPEEPQIFYFSPYWQSQPLTEKTVKHLGPLLVLDHQDEQAASLRKEYPESVFLVRTGPSFRRLSDFVYRINPGKEEDYFQLVRELSERGIVPGAILHFWHFRMEDGERQIFNNPIQGEPYLQTQVESGLYSVFHFCQAWLKLMGNRRLRFMYLQGGSQPRPQHEMLLGYMRSVSREFTNIQFKMISRRGILSHNLSWIPNLLHELGEAGSEPIQVRFSDGRRQALGLQEISMPEKNEARVLPRAGAVYLITGALGSLGYPIAGFLARHYGAKLILTGRSGLNERIEEKLANLQLAGAEVLYVPTNLAGAEETEALVAAGIERFGAIHGIVHVASRLELKPFTELNLKDFRAALGPKASGLLNLDYYTREQPLEFMLLVSSAAAWFGAAKMTPFATANAFLDSFAAFRNSLGSERPGHTTAICWPMWGELTPESVSAELPDPTLSDSVARAIFEDSLALRRSRLLALYGLPHLVRGFARFESDQHEDDELPDGLSPGDTAAFLRHLIGRENSDKDRELGLKNLDSEAEKSITRNLAAGLNSTLRGLLDEYSTIKDVTDFIANNERGLLSRLLSSHRSNGKPGESKEPGKVKPKRPKNAIAVVGLAGRFPGGADLDSFWDNLCNRHSAVDLVPGDRWDWQHLEQEFGVTCRWGGFLDDVQRFDNDLFQIETREARAMDPGERILLETVWALFENAGYTAETLNNLKHEIGVFVAGSHDPPSSSLGVGHSLWLSADRISSFFDLHGPSIPVDTGSSSSLTALHLACESLRRGECRAAIVAGINLHLQPDRYLHLDGLNLLATDGRMHSFEAGRHGLVPGEGVGALLLKPLDAALKSDDHCFAVIRGTAVSHRGRAGNTITPNPEAQAEVVTKAFNTSAVNPATIAAVEIQGFGAQLGDQMEIAGLAKAFGHQAGGRQFCAVGTLKPNIGHLEAASGIATLIKMVLQLYHNHLAPTLLHDEINPALELKNTPFYLQTEKQHWPQMAVDGQAQPRRGLITTVGDGGTGAAVILEERARRDSAPAPNAPAHELILLSARDENRLRDRARALADYLKAAEESENPPSLRNIAYTLQIGREHMQHRLALLIDTQVHLREELEQFLEGGDSQVQLGHEQSDRVFGLSLQDRAYLKGLADTGHLGQLAALWLEGARIDWRILRLSGKMEPLPVYPFQGQSFEPQKAAPPNKPPATKAGEGEAVKSEAPAAGRIPPEKIGELYRMLTNVAEGQANSDTLKNVKIFR